MHVCFALHPARRVIATGKEDDEDPIHNQAHHGSTKGEEIDNDEAEAESNNRNNEGANGTGEEKEGGEKDTTTGDGEDGGEGEM